MLSCLMQLFGSCTGCCHDVIKSREKGASININVLHIFSSCTMSIIQKLNG